PRRSLHSTRSRLALRAPAARGRRAHHATPPRRCRARRVRPYPCGAARPVAVPAVIGIFSYSRSQIMYEPTAGPVSPRPRVPAGPVAIPRDRSRNGCLRCAVRPKPGARAQQAESGLAVADGSVERPVAGRIEWHPVNLDDFRMLLRRTRRADAAGEKQVEPLGEYPG